MKSNLSSLAYTILHEFLSLREQYTVCEIAWLFTIVSEC
jgi:hypothetical protein